MIDFAPLIAKLAEGPLAPWAELLPQQVADGMAVERWGDLPGWQ